MLPINALCMLSDFFSFNFKCLDFRFKTELPYIKSQVVIYYSIYSFHSHSRLDIDIKADLSFSCRLNLFTSVYGSKLNIRRSGNFSTFMPKYAFEMCLPSIWFTLDPFGLTLGYGTNKFYLFIIPRIHYIWK